jgi:para-nitrobenzyl esterase
MQASFLSRRTFLSRAGLAALVLSGRNLSALGPVSAARVRTTCGTLCGEQAGGVRVFRGVPFAAPPVGPLRFRAPAKVKRWTGEREATRFAAAPMSAVPMSVVKNPPQAVVGGVVHSEDCLYLNLWVPEGKGPFPVYMWIHGGGFISGKAFEPMYDGTAQALAGVLCVTVAYRLGVFGFLDMEPLLGASFAGSANNSLRDLIAALEWVRENIADFGGDPSRVTIGGESAGAKLTDILLGTPSAQQLFHQAISESGGAERVWTRAHAAEVAEGFAEQWKAENDRSSFDRYSLLTAPADAIIRAQQHFLQKWPERFPLRAEIDGVLLPRRPVETIAAGSGCGKRLLIGTNRDECSQLIGAHPAHDPDAGNLGNLSVSRFSEVFHRYREVYPHMTDEQLRIRALTAEEYWVPSIRAVEALVRGGGRAWVYLLDFAESSGALKGFAFHTLDVRMVWDRPSAQAANARAEAALARQMSQAWIAFLRGEAPASHGLPFWPEYRADFQATMLLDAESRVELNPQEAELRLWNGVL